MSEEQKETLARLDMGFFPNFVRAVNPAAGQFSDEALRGLGVGFREYLDTLDISPAVRAKMYEINPVQVLPRISRWGFVLGYHSALVWHFNRWIKDLMDKAGIEIVKQ